MLVYRIRQFWRGMWARLSNEDYEYVARHLTEPERALFYQMAVCDQRHCVEVARQAESLGRARGVGQKHLSSLICACLLHDIGKVRGDVNLLYRAAFVLLSRMPALLKKYARRGEASRRGFTYACYVMLHHPQRGAKLAETFGVSDEVVSLIRRHHDDPGEDLVLSVMQEADSEA